MGRSNSKSALVWKCPSAGTGMGWDRTGGMRLCLRCPQSALDQRARSPPGWGQWPGQGQVSRFSSHPCPESPKPRREPEGAGGGRRNSPALLFPLPPRWIFPGNLLPRSGASRLPPAVTRAEGGRHTGILHTELKGTAGALRSGFGASLDFGMPPLLLLPSLQRCLRLTQLPFTSAAKLVPAMPVAPISSAEFTLHQSQPQGVKPVKGGMSTPPLTASVTSTALAAHALLITASQIGLGWKGP